MYFCVYTHTYIPVLLDCGILIVLDVDGSVIKENKDCDNDIRRKQ